MPYVRQSYLRLDAAHTRLKKGRHNVITKLVAKLPLDEVSASGVTHIMWVSGSFATAPHRGDVRLRTALCAILKSLWYRYRR